MIATMTRRIAAIILAGGLMFSFYNLPAARAQVDMPTSVPTAPSPANSYQPVPMMQLPLEPVPYAPVTPDIPAAPAPTPQPPVAEPVPMTPVPQAPPAQQTACYEATYCAVVAPTVLLPAYDSAPVEPGEVLITGVSFNDTVVDVYIDDIYNGRAVFRPDASGVGNFYYRPFVALSPGEHVVFTVARNTAETERSIESRRITFTVAQAQVPVTEAPVVLGVSEELEDGEDDAPAPSDEPVETTTPTVTPTTTPSANNILQRFFGLGRATGTATTTEGAGGLRTLLLVAAIVIVIILILRRMQRGGRGSSDSDKPGSGTGARPPDDLPPPPV